MKRMSWLLVVPLAVVAAAAMVSPVGCVEFESFGAPDGSVGGGGKGGGGTGGGTPSSSSSGGGMGGAGGCMKADDCGETTPCGTPVCTQGKCSWTDVAPKGPNQQIPDPPGDCKNVVCDGNGFKLVQTDSTDTYDYGNPCIEPDCSAGAVVTPQHVMKGTACSLQGGGSGYCDGAGHCSECGVDGNCMNGEICQLGLCVPSTCNNNMTDGTETDLNCGGTCAPCADGKTCGISSDCASQKCSGAPKVCQPHLCTDSIPNGDETGTDCGGSCVTSDNKTCGDGVKCLHHADCGSNHCEKGVCAQP